MSPALRIGDPVQIDETTEVLTLVALDGEYAWVRDGAGNHITHKLVDLVRAHSRAFSGAGEFEWTTLGNSGAIPKYYWRGEWEKNT